MPSEQGQRRYSIKTGTFLLLPPWRPTRKAPGHETRP